MYGVIVNYPCFGDPDWERLVKQWFDDELREVAKRAIRDFSKQESQEATVTDRPRHR